MIAHDTVIDLIALGVIALGAILGAIRLQAREDREARMSDEDRELRACSHLPDAASRLRASIAQDARRNIKSSRLQRERTRGR